MVLSTIFIYLTISFSTGDFDDASPIYCRSLKCAYSRLSIVTVTWKLFNKCGILSFTLQESIKGLKMLNLLVCEGFWVIREFIGI